MIYLKIEEMLDKRNKSKYWFITNMEGGYQALTKLMNNEAKAIRFSTLDKMCQILDCEVGDLIVYNKRKRRKKSNEKNSKTNPKNEQTEV